MPAKTAAAENNRLVDQIKNHLKRTGKRQYQLAAELGVPVQTVSRWMNKKSTISKSYRFMLEQKKVIATFIYAEYHLSRDGKTGQV